MFRRYNPPQKTIKVGDNQAKKGEQPNPTTPTEDPTTPRQAPWYTTRYPKKPPIPTKTASTPPSRPA